MRFRFKKNSYSLPFFFHCLFFLFAFFSYAFSEDEVLYHDYQEAKQLWYAGSFAEAQMKYADLIKKANGFNREEMSDLAKEMEVKGMLCLGELHVLKNTKLSLIQAACLFNYAHLAALEGDREEFVTESLDKLMQTEKVLRAHCQAQIQEIDPNIDIDNKRALAKIRDKIHEKITSTTSPQEINTEWVKKIYKEIALEMKQFIVKLLKQSLEILGPPPCGFVMIGLGSLAREEITPYSDLEFAFLIEEESETTREYFRDLTYLMHLRVVNLGETTPWHLDIEALRTFFDRLTPRGFTFDGRETPREHPVKAYKTPLGNWGVLGIQASEWFELIQTPRKMAEYQGKSRDGEYWFKKNPHLPMELLHFCPIYVHDNPSLELVANYQEAMNQRLDDFCEEEACTVREYLAKKLLYEEDMENFEPSLGDLEEGGKFFHVKKDLYRFPHLSIDRLALLLKVEDQNTFDRIDDLSENGVLTEEGAKNLKRIIADAIYARLEVYSHYKRQKDEMNPILKYFGLDNPDLVKKHFSADMQTLERIERIYQVIVPLYEGIKAFLSGNKEILSTSSLLDDSLITQGKIALRLLQYERAKEYFLKQKEETPYDVSLLNGLGVVFLREGDLEKAIENINRALRIKIHRYGENHCYLIKNYNNLGSAYRLKGDLEKAIDHITKALAIAIREYGEDSDQLSRYYNNLGLAYKDKGDLEKAIEHLNKSLIIDTKNKNNPGIATRNNNLGLAHQITGELEEAIEYLNKSLNVNCSLYGNKHPKVAINYNNLGTIYRDKGDLDQAIESISKALEINRFLFGQSSLQVARNFNNLALVYQDKGDLKQAIEYFSQALEIEYKIFGENSSQVAKSYNNLGGAYRDKGNFDQAIKYINKSLEIVHCLYEEDSPKIAMKYYNLGCTYQDKGDFDQAAEYLNRALNIARLYGENSKDVSKVYNSLGVNDLHQGNLISAIENVNKALNINLALYKDKKHPQIAVNYNNLGEIYQVKGDFDQSIETIFRALEINVCLYGKSSIQAAKNYNNLGLAYKMKGDFDQAIEYLNKGLMINLNNNYYIGLGINYNNLGLAYKIKGDFDQAISYIEKALKINSELFGKNSIKVANNYNNLGDIYAEKRDLNRAIEYLSEGLKINRALYCENSPQLANSYNNLGNTYKEQGDLEKAVEYLNKSLEINLYLYGEKSAQVATNYQNLASAYQLKGDAKLAVNYAKKALQINIEIFGENAPQVALNYNMLGLVYLCQKDAKSAFENISKSLEINLCIYGEKSRQVASNYSDLSIVYRHKGEIEEATDYLEKALEIEAEIFGKESFQVAILKHGLAVCLIEKHIQQKNLEQAIKEINQILAIDCEVFGENSTQVIELYVVLGTVYALKGKLDLSIKLIEKALNTSSSISGKDSFQTQEIRQALEIARKAKQILSENASSKKRRESEDAETFEEDSNQVAISKHNSAIALIQNYIEKGNLEQAIISANETLIAACKTFGENSLQVGELYTALGAIYGKKEESFDRSIECLEKALNINRSVFGEDSSQVHQIQEALQLICKVKQSLSLDIDSAQVEMNPALFEAIERGDLSEVITQVEKATNLRQTIPFTTKRENTPFSLHLDPIAFAIANGQIDCLDALLNAKSLKEQQRYLRTCLDKVGTPLHLAIYQRQYPTLKHLLLKYGSHDNPIPLCEVQDQMGRSLFSLACFLGDLEAMELLFYQGAKINGREGGEIPPLYWAIEQAHINAIDALDYLGANLQPACLEKGPIHTFLFHLLSEAEDTNDHERRTRLLACQNSLNEKIIYNNRLKFASPNFFEKPPENLVFEGGGPKGIAYVGALEYMKTKGVLREVRRVAGTSAGAITAALLAVGFEPEEIKEELAVKNLTDFLDPEIDIQGIPLELVNEKYDDLSSFFKKKREDLTLFEWIDELRNFKKIMTEIKDEKGICQGEDFRRWIEGKIFEKTGIVHCTFRELHKLVLEKPYQYKDLYVFATKIGDRQDVVQFDFSQSPDLVISDAIRASMSIPVVFRPHQLHTKSRESYERIPDETGERYVDGGMLRNFPLDIFDDHGFQHLEERGKRTNRRTLGFGFIKEETSPSLEQETSISFFGFVKNIINTYYQAEHLLSKLHHDAQGRTVLIDPLDIGLLDFHLTKEQTNQLIQSGYHATHSFFSSWIMKKQAQNPFNTRRMQVDLIPLGCISRKEEKELFDLFALNSSFAPFNETKTSLLWGREKMGKTTLAKQFAWNHQNYFSLLFMFDGSEKDQERLLALAHLLEIPSPETRAPEELIDQLCLALENHQKKRPYLLIFDGPAWDRLPEKGGCILFISEDKKGAPTPFTPLIEVKGFSTEEALRLFEQITGEGRSKEMEELVEICKYFPKQVHEAAQAISLSNETTTSYLEKTLPQRWEHTLELLKQQHPEAFRYLAICSCLPSDHIPLSWLESWIPRKSLLTAQAIVTALQDFGCIETVNDQKKMTLKEGIAKAFLEKMTLQERETFAIDALYLFAKKGSPDYRFETLENQTDHHTFALALKKLASTGHSDRYLLEFMKSAVHLGNRFIQSNQFHQGKELLEVALEKIDARSLKDTATTAYDEIYYFLISLNKSGKFPADFATHYARCLYYFGTALSKIADQTDDSKLLEEAGRYFERAIALRNRIDKGAYQEEEKYHIDTVIFQRNGRGWLWLSSNDPEKWRQAEKLYLKLHDWKNHQGHIDRFNQALCKVRLSRLYLKWARVSSIISYRGLYKKAKEQIGEVDEEGRGISGAMQLFTEIENETGKKYDRYGRALLDLSHLYLDPYSPYLSLPKANHCIEKALDRTDQTSQPRLLAELYLQKGNYHFLSSKESWTTRSEQKHLNQATSYAKWAQEIYVSMEKSENPELVGIKKTQELQHKCHKAMKAASHPSWIQGWVNWMVNPKQDTIIQSSN